MRALALVLALVLLVAASPAQAQVVQASLAFSAMPAETATNRSLAIVPFEVTFSIAQAACLTEATYHAALSATAETGDNRTVDVQLLPSQLSFTFGTPNTLTGGSRSQDAVLEVARGAVLDAPLTANVTVTATITGMTGCGPTAQASGFDATAQTQVTFESGGPDDPAPADDGQAMPAPPAAWLLVALLASVALARRGLR